MSVLDGVILPATCSLSVGADTPIPMLPPARTVKSDCPVEDATLNGFSGVDDELCTLRAKLDEDALTPRTTPLSMRVEVPTVVLVNQRVA